MLKVLLALLAFCCMCFKECDLFHTIDPDDVFPEFPRFTDARRDLLTNLGVTRASQYGLKFFPVAGEDIGHFYSPEGECFDLTAFEFNIGSSEAMSQQLTHFPHSTTPGSGCLKPSRCNPAVNPRWHTRFTGANRLAHVFFGGEYPAQLFLRFKSRNVYEENEHEPMWTVVSYVYTPPEPEYIRGHSIPANTLTADVVDLILSEDDVMERSTKIGVQWVVDILTKYSPLFYKNIFDDPLDKVYCGLPVLIDTDVKEKLQLLKSQLLYTNDMTDMDNFEIVNPLDALIMNYYEAHNNEDDENDEYAYNEYDEYEDNEYVFVEDESDD